MFDIHERERVPLVIFFDVDNTLLDNDSVTRDLRRHLELHVGEGRADRYFALFEDLRRELGYADYLGALQRYRVERPQDAGVLEVSRFLLGYPFANRLYPGSLDAVEHCRSLGRVAILTDGDVVFQPRKIWRSGLWEAFGGEIVLALHKELELEEVARRQPAERYVLVDDKVRILAAVKEVWGDRVTTVFPRQGHYAVDAELVARYPAPDLTIERIGDLVDLAPERLLEPAQVPRSS